MMTPVPPVESLRNLSAELNVDLRCKRDDLLPLSGGGNKVRKGVRILEYALSNGYNAFVTTGGTQSNHARVIALLAARQDLPCRMILHGIPSEIKNPTGNLLLTYLSGARIEIVDSTYINTAMKKAMGELEGLGYRPYEIPGGGHCLVGSLAYFDAVSELEIQCKESGWIPDWIIHASGTGATQAGISVGVRAAGWKTDVVGVSVARLNPRGKDVVLHSCKELARHLKLTFIENFDIDFRDEWVGDGYETAGESVFSAIRMAAVTEGIILDPTYTGKAFAAMLELIRTNEIKKGSKVLFWHTGGLLNLTSSQYIGDILAI